MHKPVRLFLFLREYESRVLPDDSFLNVATSSHADRWLLLGTEAAAEA